MHIAPVKPDQFAYPEPCVHRDVDHRGVGLPDKCEQSSKLRRVNVRLGTTALLVPRKPYSLSRICNQKPVVFSRTERARKYVPDLVLRLKRQWRRSHLREILL